MRSPVTALAWEIFRQRHRSVWSVLGIIAISSLLACVISGKPNVFENIEALFWLLMMACFFLIFAIFSCTEFNAVRNWHGFPYRLFTLPVPTLLLVICPMLLGVTAIGVAYLAWAKLIFAPMGKTLPLWPALILEAGIMCYQALVWSLAGFRITRMIVLGVAGLVFMDLAMLPAYPELLAHRHWKELVTFLSELLAGLAAAAFFGAWFSVERQRRGGGRGRGWMRERIGLLVDALPRRTRDFSSPAAAQFWFEWRRAGLILPICSGAVLLFIFGPVSWFARHNAGMALWILGWLVAVPVILAAVIGRGFAKPDFWSGDLSLPPFQAVQPLASGEMVVSKMKVAALSVAIAWLLVLVFLGCWLPGWADTTQLKDLWDTLVVLRTPYAADAILVLSLWAAVILTWRGMVGSLWIGLSGNPRRFICVSVLQAAAVFFVVRVCFKLKESGWKSAPQNVALIGWALALAAMLKLWLAAFSWNKISPRRIWQYALAWATGTLGLVALGLLICPDIFWLKHLFILAALLPFPIAGLGFAPRALERNRHR